MATGISCLPQVWDPRLRSGEGLAVQACSSHAGWISAVAWHPSSGAPRAALGGVWRGGASAVSLHCCWKGQQRRWRAVGGAAGAAPAPDLHQGTSTKAPPPEQDPTLPSLPAAAPPAAHHVATASHDGTAKLWDLRTAIPLHTLEGHTDKVLSAAWAAPGLLATGGADCKLRTAEVQLGSGQ